MPMTQTPSRGKRKFIGFGRNTSKRAKTTPTTVVFRGPRPEMKHGQIALSSTGATSYDLAISAISQSIGVADRIGAQTKLHYINGIIRTDVPIRMDVYVPYEASTNATHTLDQAFDLRTGYLLKTFYFNPPTSATNNGFVINLKLPYGIKQSYSGVLPSDIQKGNVKIRVQGSANFSLSGFMQTFYTDA